MIYIQEYILHSWSLVKIGTTAAQKKLFFNLRRIKNELKLINDNQLSADQVKKIAKELSVAENEVLVMNGRMSGQDHSLNAPLKSESNIEWQDWLVDSNSENQEERLVDNEEYKYRKTILGNALNYLNDREKYVFKARRVNEDQSTLEELSQKFNVSRERIRQIEVRAFEKVQQQIKGMTKDKDRVEMITMKKNTN